MASPSAHTQAPLSLEQSRSVSDLRKTSQSSSSSAALASSTSSSPSPFLLTLRIVRLVNTFRKRAKTRVHARHPKKETSAKVRRDFCQAFERQAFDEIDRYLGRKTAHPLRKGRKDGGYGSPLLERTALDSDLTAVKGPKARKPNIEWLLDEINQSVTSSHYTLSRVAKEDSLFLDRRTELHIQKLSLKELTELLVTVKDLLETLTRASPPRRGARTLCEGNELLDLTLDETYLANLEHLLLCLQDQLIRLLISTCVDLVHRHVLECQKDQTKHGEEWFFEFPDARHPLSTTWPWSIRPSLAVIWGVCWMFYDYNALTFDANGNMVDVLGNIVVPNFAIQNYRYGMQQQQRQRQASYSPANNPGQTFGPSRHPIYPTPEAQPRYTENADPMATQPQRGGAPIHHFPSSRPPSSQASAGDQVPHAGLGLASQGTNNTYSAAPPSAWTGDTSAGWLPQENFALAGLGTNNQDSTYAADDSAIWQLPPHSSAPTGQQPEFDFPEPALPPRARNPVTPTIRLTTDFSGFPSGVQQTPQDTASYYSASSNSSVPLQEDIYHLPFSAHLSPQDTRFMNQQMPRENMDMPVSPISTHSPHQDNATLPELLSRKRSHSQMRDGEGAPPQQLSRHHSRAGSLASAVAPNSASPPAEDYSPRGSRSFKRGDPPVNSENKYYCELGPECAGQVFDRKCEWSKHMDKHDRPYRCAHQSCAKLQGFTYSGGLLRHEREVHGKHGGPKAQLMCPFEDCKRHSGKGFTRKENLNEHIRRVHENKPQLSQQLSQQPSQLDYKPELQEIVAGAEQLAEPPVARMYDDEGPTEMHLEPSLGKRKRSEVERSPSVDVEDLKQEVKRLREDNASKDERLRRMEAAEAMRETQMLQLQNAVSSMQQVQQGLANGQGEQAQQDQQGPV